MSIIKQIDKHFEITYHQTMLPIDWVNISKDLNLDFEKSEDVRTWFANSLYLQIWQYCFQFSETIFLQYNNEMGERVQIPEPPLCVTHIIEDVTVEYQQLYRNLNNVVYCSPKKIDCGFCDNIYGEVWLPVHLLCGFENPFGVEARPDPIEGQLFKYMPVFLRKCLAHLSLTPSSEFSYPELPTLKSSLDVLPTIELFGL